MDKSELIDYLNSIEADVALLNDAISQAHQSYRNKSGTHAVLSMIQMYLRDIRSTLTRRVAELEENGFSQ